MRSFFPQPVFHPDPPPAPPPAPPPPAPPPAPPGNLLETVGDPPPQDITALPENWRDLMGGTDATYLEELGRYKSPTDVIKSLVETKKTLRSRAEPEPMPGDDKPDEQKAWREKHGVPLEATGYTLGEKDALKGKFGDADKPALDNFFEWAHKGGKSQAVVNDFLGWYSEYALASEELLAENDKKDITTSEDLLREEWGPDYRRNLNTAAKAAAELFGDKDTATKYGAGILDARLPNGTKLGSIPSFVQGLLKAALAVYGDGNYVGDEAVKATQSRKAELEAWAARDYNEYREKGGQKEYGEILAAEERRNNNMRR